MRDNYGKDVDGANWYTLDAGSRSGTGMGGAASTAGAAATGMSGGFASLAGASGPKFASGSPRFISLAERGVRVDRGKTFEPAYLFKGVIPLRNGACSTSRGGAAHDCVHVECTEHTSELNPTHDTSVVSKLV
jgi:hypothetical protein